MESGRHNQTNGNHKVGNVNVQIGDKEGIYAGSASNMARLFILCNVIWACMIGEFIDEMEERHPEKVQNFMLAMEDEFSFFLTEREAKEVVEKMENESKEHPKGEKWNKETVLKVFADAGHPTSNARYSENGVYWAMNMVYSDFFPMYKDDVSKYIEHAYLFLNDKDYSGKYSKEKWYAKKRT